VVRHHFFYRTRTVETLVVRDKTQNLGLAGNPIVGIRHLSGLRGLPSLGELTLDDIHFGTCPVVTKEGYRSFVLCSLRQVGLGLVPLAPCETKGGGGTRRGWVAVDIDAAGVAAWRYRRV